MNTRMKALTFAGAAFATLLAGTSLASAADDVASFYKGKTIDLIIGYSPGGGYDLYARLVARFLGPHIPGNPTIVPRNMPGAGSRKAAVYIHDAAPQDGSVLGTIDQALAVAQAMGDPMLHTDARDFGYVGSPTMENNVLITWHTSGIKTVDDAKKTEVPIGATGSSTGSQYPKIMNELLGTKFKVINGYPGGNDINLAMEKGEVAGRGSVNWASLKPIGWYDKKLINVIVQVGLEPEADLPDVPLLYNLAENDQAKQALRLLCAASEVGRPILTTPNVPKERLEALRKAFDEMVKDPQFLEAAQKEGLGVHPIAGTKLAQTVNEIVATPKDVSDLVTKIIGIPQ